LLCRVVQKNLVFVVGLSPRLCDAEILRRHEYFGKFGKIHKVVINQSTSYVGSQVRSALASVVLLKVLLKVGYVKCVGNQLSKSRLQQSPKVKKVEVLDIYIPPLTGKP